MIVFSLFLPLLFTAARSHIFDSSALKEKANEIDLILEEMFMSESLQDDHNVIQFYTTTTTNNDHIYY
jgi:hypothetical protein